MRVLALVAALAAAFACGWCMRRPPAPKAEPPPSWETLLDRVDCTAQPVTDLGAAWAGGLYHPPGTTVDECRAMADAQ